MQAANGGETLKKFVLDYAGSSEGIHVSQFWQIFTESRFLNESFASINQVLSGWGGGGGSGISLGRVVVISEVLKLLQVVKTFENTFHFLRLNWGASWFSHTHTNTHLSSTENDPARCQKSSGALLLYCGLWEGGGHGGVSPVPTEYSDPPVHLHSTYWISGKHPCVYRCTDPEIKTASRVGEGVSFGVQVSVREDGVKGQSAELFLPSHVSHLVTFRCSSRACKCTHDAKLHLLHDQTVCRYIYVQLSSQAVEKLIFSPLNSKSQTFIFISTSKVKYL